MLCENATDKFISPELKNRLRQLARQRKTAFYYYHLDTIRSVCRQFREIPYGNKAIHFATMANSHPTFLDVIKKEGMKVFVNSLQHLNQVVQAGFHGEEIVYTASAMDESTMRTAHRQDTQVNLDSPAQIEQWNRLFPGSRFGIRCNIGDLVEPRQTRGGYFIGKESRLGLSLEEIRQLHGRSDITGLHLYVGTDILEIDYFLDCYTKLIQLAADFPSLDYLDFGGGFGVRDDDSGCQFDLQTFGHKVALLMKSFSNRTGRNIKLILEPGRILGAAAGFFTCKAIDVKFSSTKQLIGVNASSAQFPRPLLYPGTARHPVAVLQQKPAKARQQLMKSAVFGCSTYSRDWLAHEVQLPQVAPGDIIIFGNAGSYCAAAHTSFLGFPKAEEIFE